MKSRTHSLTVLAAVALVAALFRAAPACASEGGEQTEANVARAAAGLLDGLHFSWNPLDERLSSKFLDQYLDALDGGHLLFLQCDLDEFDRFRPDLALMAAREGETQPAHIIYARYLKRFAQQVNFQTNLLRAEKFDFTGADVWQADRREAAPPRDLAAAQALWREETREDYLQEKLASTPNEEIAPMLARRYEGRLQTMRRLDPNQVLGIYLDALAHVYDPHSDYFGREEWENFNIGMKLSLVGIGGTLRAKRGYSVIGDLIPGGPAARSGLLKPGDRIVAVAQGEGEPVNVIGMPPSQVVEMLRGLKGSTVRLTIIPAGAKDSASKTISLVRDDIKLAEEHAKAAIIDLPQPGGLALRLGVIDLPSFYGMAGQRADGASSDITLLIKKLKQEGMRGLILDLRRNGGGSLEEAVRLTGLFIPSGPVVQTWMPENEPKIGTSPEIGALYDGPLVVLTSRLSASASEIVAGALQDYGRALIVGDSSTFGKGTAQTIVPLKTLLHDHGLGAVKVTIDSAGMPPARAPDRPAADADFSQGNPDDGDVELSETEHILADYIHALPGCPARVIVALATPGATDQPAANDK